MNPFHIRPERRTLHLSSARLTHYATQTSFLLADQSSPCCSQPRYTILVIVPLAIATTVMPFLTICYLATHSTARGPLSFRRQSPVPSDLLVVPITISLSDRRVATSWSNTHLPPSLTLRKQAPMVAHLLIVLRTVPSGLGFPFTSLCFTRFPHKVPLSLRRHSQISPQSTRRTQRKTRTLAHPSSGGHRRPEDGPSSQEEAGSGKPCYRRVRVKCT